MSRLSTFSPRQRYLVSALVAAAAIGAQSGCDRAKPATAAAAAPAGTGAGPSAAPAASTRSISIGNAATLALSTTEPVQFSAATLDASGKPALVSFGTFDPPAGVLAAIAHVSPGGKLRLRVAPHSVQPGDTLRIAIDGPIEKLAELPMSAQAAEYVLTVGPSPTALEVTSAGGQFRIAPKAAKP